MLIVINDVSGSLGANKPKYLGLVQSSMAHQFAGERSHAHQLIHIGRL